jgi:hypothetical protein
VLGRLERQHINLAGMSGVRPLLRQRRAEAHDGCGPVLSLPVDRTLEGNTAPSD